MNSSGHDRRNVPAVRVPAHDAVEHLTTAECWALIEARSFGRLAVEGLDGVPDVFPLNYTVHDGSIYIRSAHDAKLMALAVHPHAAFEIDGEDDGLRWSVVLRGTAHRLAIDKEIRESGVQSLVSASPTDKFNYICVIPTSISGRRFVERGPHAPPGHGDVVTRNPLAQEPSRSYEETAMSTNPEDLRQHAPVLIAHFPPR